MMLSSGETLAGRYRIVREIGQGGFGRVYLADELERRPPADGSQTTLPLMVGADPVLRRVALKVFGTNPRMRQGLVAELRALCRLSHPNIVAVYDYDLAEPSFIAMEYVVGRDLHTWLEERGPLGLADALSVARQVGEALAHAHAVGLLHRDVKPSNVMVTEKARAKLVDFGLARNAERLSRVSTQIGTPGFVAPELLDPDRFRYPIGVAADVYGLGCLLFATLVGSSPFAGDTPVQILRHQLAGKRRSTESLHPLLEAVVEQATALDPARRYPSVQAMLEALRRIHLGLDSAPALQSRGPRRVDLVDVQALSLDEFDHPERGRGLKFELAAPASGQVHRGFLYEQAAGSASRQLFESLACGWAGCELSLYGAVEVASPEKGRFFSGDGATVPIIEPHFLVSVTDVVRSQGVRARDCAARPFVDARQTDGVGPPIVLGRLLHTVLDDLVEGRARHEPFDTVFESAFSRCRMEAVAAGIRDADMPDLRQRAEGPFEWLRRFVERHVTGAGNSVEVTRFSGRYGIEGRIDLALLTPDRLEIVELKTGRRQTLEHEAQLRCYTLLWDHFARAEERSVRGRLLYCQGGLEKAVPRQDHDVERRILLTRNQIVAAHQALASGRLEAAMPHYGQWPERCNDAACRFRSDRCREQSARIGLGRWNDAAVSAGRGGPFEGLPADLIEAARAYYRHFVRLVELEYVTQSNLQGDFTRPAGVALRVAESGAVDNATLVEWDAALKAVKLACEDAQRFVPGMDVVAHRGDPDAQATLVGRIEGVDPNGIVLRSEGAAVCGEVPREGWIIERLNSRIGWREAHRALYGLLMVRDQRRLRTLLFGGDAGDDEPEGRKSVGPFPDRLNPSQQRAIALALEEPRRPVLIHGPPGTGKTTVIAALVESLVARGQRVLVAAGTNTAVDNVVARLIEQGTDVLRLGYLTPGSSLRAVRPRAQLVRHVVGELSRTEGSLDAIVERLGTVPVVAGTAHRCIRSNAIDAICRISGGPGPGGAPVIPFDVAVVDEATQITEPLTLGAVLLAQRFVLVGDGRQLPPVITSEQARTALLEEAPSGLIADMGLAGLDRTLFERLSGRAIEARLEVQYRMSREIQELSNRLYYGGSLLPDASNEGRRLALDETRLVRLAAPIRARLTPDRPVVWETLRAIGADRCNPVEVDAVSETIAGLLQSVDDPVLWAGRIGVISPFRAQCHAIRSALASRLPPEQAPRVEVDTVERFQGREKEVMVVSLVVSTWSDFVMDDRRLNVAFTRARSKLIVFGPAQLLYRIEQS